MSTPEPKRAGKPLQTFSLKTYFENCLQLPCSSQGKMKGQRMTFQLFTCTLRMACLTTPTAMKPGPAGAHPVGVHTSNQLRVLQQPLWPKLSLPWGFLRALAASSTLHVLLLARAEGHLGSCPDAGAWWAPTCRRLCMPQTEVCHALPHRSLGSPLPKPFAVGLPNPSWTVAKLTAYLKQQVGLQCTVTPVQVQPSPSVRF